MNLVICQGPPPLRDLFWVWRCIDKGRSCRFELACSYGTAFSSFALNPLPDDAVM